MSSFKIRTCHNCHKASVDRLKVCGDCKYAYYCDRACQIQNRSVHKLECKEMLRLSIINKPFNDICKQLELTKLPVPKSSNVIRGCLIQINNLAKFIDLETNIKQFINTVPRINNDKLTYICTSYDDYDLFLKDCEVVNDLIPEYHLTPAQMFNQFDEDSVCCLIYCPEIPNYCVKSL